MIGLRELLIIGMVVLVLYGRSGVFQSQRARTILPWLSPLRRTPARGGPAGRAGSARAASAIPRRSRVPGAFLVRGQRIYWFLTILAATAVAAWVVTRTLITSGTAARLVP
jgi:hypothetical protein